MVTDICGQCGGTNSCIGCDGKNDSKSYDSCGSCGGSDDCLGCDNVPWSGKVTDDCGICGGSNECIGCDGEVDTYEYDLCGECNGTNACLGCDGVAYSGLVRDEYVCNLFLFPTFLVAMCAVERMFVLVVMVWPGLAPVMINVEFVEAPVYLALGVTVSCGAVNFGILVKCVKEIMLVLDAIVWIRCSVYLLL